MEYKYKYPRPMVTVDIMLLRIKNDKLQILLIKRKNEPYQGYWALPGGFVEMSEKLIESAYRELREETAVTSIKLYQLHSFGNPERDPRGRTITVLYAGFADNTVKVKAGDDAAETGWFTIDALPETAFDHRSVIEFSRKVLKERIAAKGLFLAFGGDDSINEKIYLTL